MTTRFGVLGALRLPADARIPPLRGPQVRKVLALLLLQANRPVTVEALVDELWDGEPPATATATVRTHVYHLRRLLDQRLRSGGGLVATTPTGYAIEVPEDDVDAHLFLRLTDHGGRLLADDQLARAADTLRRGLALWRGPALADVRPGPLLSRHVARLELTRIRAQELRIDAEMRLGRHRELVAELGDLVEAHPLHEWFHARYIDALHRSGRRGEAVRAFRRLRTLLNSELGLDPSAELQHLLRRVLAVGAGQGVP